MNIDERFYPVKRILSASKQDDLLYSRPISEGINWCHCQWVYNRASACQGGAFPVKYLFSEIQNPELCPAGSDVICAVQIDYTVASSVSELNGVGIPGIMGDFSFNRNVDILGYKYRSN